MEESFKRSAEWAAEKTKEKAAAAGLPAQLGDEEEDDERDPDAEEEQLRRNYEEILGAVMEVAPAEFLQCLMPCSEKIKLWIANNQIVLALYLACDLILHLKEQSLPAWPNFMPKVFEALGSTDPDARTAASYAVNLAAPLAAFNEAAPQAFRILTQIVSGPRPKKRDEKAKLAFDNAVAGLLTLAVEKSEHCPAELQGAWPAIIAKLPIRDDEDEAKKVHDKVADLVLAQHKGILGPDTANLGPVLAILAEVFHVENICKKETEEKILKIFKLLPQDVLKAKSGSFSEKQQRKIEKMLSA